MDGPSLGCGPSGVIHPRDRAASAPMISELLEGKRDSVEIRSEVLGKSGRCLHWTFWRSSQPQGSQDVLLAMAHSDMQSPTIEQQQQAERLETVGRLAGGVAHDFNNLLTGVLLYCDLLMATLDPSQRAQKYAEEIRKAGMQASGLVRQLLVIAKPARGAQQLISLNDIAEGMRNFLSRLIGENIQVRFSLDPHLGLIKMNPAQAQQILLNLVLNARDAMPTGGHIAVSTSNCRVQMFGGDNSSQQAALPCALFVVEDDGTGMDATTRAHLFEPFFTTKLGMGTGLGLTTVHGVVSGNGGLIHVDSELGRGTRISILLPVATEVPPEGSGEENPYLARNLGIHSLKEERLP